MVVNQLKGTGNMSELQDELLRIVAILNTRGYKVGDVMKETGLSYGSLSRLRNYHKLKPKGYTPEMRTISLLSSYFKP